MHEKGLADKARLSSQLTWDGPSRPSADGRSPWPKPCPAQFDYIHIELGPEKPQWYQANFNPFGTVRLPAAAGPRGAAPPPSHPPPPPSPPFSLPTNPHAAASPPPPQVPAMYVDGKPVFESLPVAEFLEDKFPGSGNRIMPSGAPAEWLQPLPAPRANTSAASAPGRRLRMSAAAPPDRKSVV